MKDILFGTKYAAMNVKERILIFVVWRLPKSLVMWAAIRLIAHATAGKYETQLVPELTALEALKRWETA